MCESDSPPEGEAGREGAARHFLTPGIHIAAAAAPRLRRPMSDRLLIVDFGSRVTELIAQDTLYPNVIESVSFAGGPSVTIKSRHNVGGLPERMNMKLVEPLRELFNDEVRALGRALGLPPDLVNRHPFRAPASRSASPAASRRRNSASCARSMPSISTRSARRASTTRSGRRSRCCCRCARSA
jgi:hypothetical protein